MTHSHLVTNMTIIMMKMMTTISNLIQISVFPLFPLLFGLVEILLAVFDLRETLLVMNPSPSAADLNN